MNATVSFPAPATQPRAHHPFPWRVFGVLLLAALFGTVTLLPYLGTLLGPTLAGRALPLELTLVLSLIQPLVLSAIAIGVGLRLGDSVGLGAPLLRDWLRGDPNAAQRLRALLLPSVVAGVVVATVLLVLEFGVFVPNLSAAARGVEAPSPPAWQGLLASFYGGIDEEILLRLGVMTLFAWIGARRARTTDRAGYRAGARAQRPGRHRVRLVVLAARAALGDGGPLRYRCRSARPHPGPPRRRLRAVDQAHPPVSANGVFRALSDPTRRGILALLRNGDLTAGNLAERFPLARSTLSEHCAVLKDAGLVVTERQGTVIVYSLNVSALEEALGALMALMRVGEEPPASAAKD